MDPIPTSIPSIPPEYGFNTDPPYEFPVAGIGVLVGMGVIVVGMVVGGLTCIVRNYISNRNRVDPNHAFPEAPVEHGIYPQDHTDQPYISPPTFVDPKDKERVLATIASRNPIDAGEGATTTTIEMLPIRIVPDPTASNGFSAVADV